MLGRLSRAELMATADGGPDLVPAALLRGPPGARSGGPRGTVVTMVGTHR